MQFNTSTFKLDTPIIRFDNLLNHVWKQTGTLIHCAFDDDIDRERFQSQAISYIINRTELLDEKGLPVYSSSGVDCENRYPILGFMGETISVDSYSLLNAIYWTFHDEERFFADILDAKKEVTEECKRLGLKVNSVSSKKSFRLRLFLEMGEDDSLILHSVEYNDSLPFESTISITAPDSLEEIAKKIRIAIEQIINGVLGIKNSTIPIMLSIKDTLLVEDRMFMGIFDTDMLTEILTRPSKSNVRFVKA